MMSNEPPSRPTFTDEDGNERQFATKAEVLEFANAVRKAGGGDVIDALFPSTPDDGTACLIANALNFECEVRGNGWRRGGYESIDQVSSDIWFMHVPNGEVALAIGRKLGLEVIVPPHDSQPYKVVLPEHIGNAAAAFDRFVDEFDGLYDYQDEEEEY